MTQIINFSLEEFELFQSFRSQLDDSFNLYRQNNLAITNQKNELIKLKNQAEEAKESFDIQKKQCERDLEATKEEIKFQKIILQQEYHRCNEARRRIRYYRKKIEKLKKELETCETSVAVSKIPTGENLKKSEIFKIKIGLGSATKTVKNSTLDAIYAQ